MSKIIPTRYRWANYRPQVEGTTKFMYVLSYIHTYLRNTCIHPYIHIYSLTHTFIYSFIHSFTFSVIHSYMNAYIRIYRVIQMIVGVLTTCHTQHTSDSSICIFSFNRTTLQVFVTYLTGALYVHPLRFYKHQHENRVRSKLFVACQWLWCQS